MFTMELALAELPSTSGGHPDVSLSHTIRLMARQEAVNRIPHHIVFCTNMMDRKTRQNPDMDWDQ
jgi:hypothetical protein